jgi:2-polyprenylphenol 6-hydroxylase
MKTIETEIIVVGAGLVGLSAAVAFAKQNKNVVLLDTNPVNVEKKQNWDARIYALSPETENWLTALQAWSGLDASRVNAIDAMHLCNDSGEELLLRCSDANVPKLGVIIENQNLIYALWQQIKSLGVTVITDENCELIEYGSQHIALHLLNKTKIKAKTKIVAKLMVAADGVNSWVRSQANIGVKQKSFHQTAIVANFSTEKPHQNIAQQWFAPHETLALLPLVGKNVSLVWSVLTERAEQLLKLSTADLATRIELYAKQELGSLKQLGNSAAFSLHQQTANSLIAERIVLVGDAAHQIHPMAGQGVNLGFRDVMQLASQATKLNLMQDIGEHSFLRQYERSRRADVATMNALTTGLDYLFASESVLLNKVTNWGLRQLNRQTTLKKLLIQQVAA